MVRGHSAGLYDARYLIRFPYSISATSKVLLDQSSFIIAIDSPGTEFERISLSELALIFQNALLVPRYEHSEG